MTRILSILAAALFLARPATAKLNIVATTPDLQALAGVVAGEHAKLSVLCAAGSDPHYLEAKPSQIIVLRKADLLVANGAELELGWLPLVLRGAQRPDLAENGERHFDASKQVELLEIPAAGATRAEGDVHPEGNPHFMLDPLRAAKVGLALGAKLAALDAPNAGAYQAAARRFADEMEVKTKAWQARVKATGLSKVIGYHKDLNYFFDRMGLEPGAYFEPKPGLPPTGRHLAALVELARDRGMRLAVLSHLYPTTPAEKIAAAVPGFHYVRVAGQVGGLEQARDLPSLYEQLVAALEGGAR